MKSTELLQEIQKVVGHELERVNTDRVPLHSQHEAYAVIKEKYEGASENVHHIEGFVEEFWECVKDKNTACYADVLMTVRESLGETKHLTVKPPTATLSPKLTVSPLSMSPKQ